MSFINYEPKFKNNAATTKVYLDKYRSIDIICIKCKCTYRYFSSAHIDVTKENRICCQVCKHGVMVPITAGSMLSDMEGDERKELISKWHYDMFQS
jgi:hypothetical protein